MPLLVSDAYLPAVADKIAVPAAPPLSGITLFDALSTVFAVIVLITIVLPGNNIADGSVSIAAPAKLYMILVSLYAVVCAAVVTVTMLVRGVAGAESIGIIVTNGLIREFDPG